MAWHLEDVGKIVKMTKVCCSARRVKEAFTEVGEEDIPEEESDVDDLSVASLETIDEIKNEEASRLLTTYADLKMKEAEALQDMVTLIKTDDLGLRQ